MLVTAHARGRGDIALLIGEHNVRRYFPQQIAAVELQLGELFIDCALPPEFWQNRPEIHDPRLKAWLKCRVFHQHPGCHPHPLNMIPVGKNAFRLQAVHASADAQSHPGPLRRPRDARVKPSGTPASPLRTGTRTGTQRAEMH